MIRLSDVYKRQVDDLLQSHTARTMLANSEFIIMLNQASTEDVYKRQGLNGKKHRRNLNILVCGGSGAGKTRFYCKPNAMQCDACLLYTSRCV